MSGNEMGSSVKIPFCQILNNASYVRLACQCLFHDAIVHHNLKEQQKGNIA
jgi:hypothetical protein